MEHQALGQGGGSLHAIGLPSFGESTMQSKPVVRRT